MNGLYEKYQGFAKQELFDVLLESQDYTPEAVDAAMQILKEKGWSAELEKIRLERQEKAEAELLLEQEEIVEKAEYYKNVVEFRNGYSFQVRIADIPRFEGILEEKNIAFFREDKNIGVQLDSYPTQSYYFRYEDAEKVDEIAKELQLITAPYTDIKPFWGFEMKAVVITIIASIGLVVLYKLLS
jgi:hypothetical protein